MSYAGGLGVVWAGAAQTLESRKGKVPFLEAGFLEPCTEAWEDTHFSDTFFPHILADTKSFHFPIPSACRICLLLCISRASTYSPVTATS